MPALELASGGQPEDPGPDDGQVAFAGSAQSRSSEISSTASPMYGASRCM
jgi:hypothetical protein